MAGDWIKMRGALLNHPKVIAITRALHANREFRDWLTPGGGGAMNGQIVSVSASRCVTVALLMRVWSSAREHGKFQDDDLILPYSEIADLDEMAGAPGVGDAMESVDWALPVNGVTLPNFKEFNVPMTEAERAKSYRERNKNVTQESRKGGDENTEIVTTRGEERRGELKDIPTIVGSPPALELLPSNIPYKEIVSLFNGLLGKLPMVRELTQKRRILIRSAWQAAKRRQSLDFWKRYFEECAEDPFMNGTGPYKPPHENWRPTFDFLMRSDQVTKVYERAMHEGSGVG